MFLQRGFLSFFFLLLVVLFMSSSNPVEAQQLKGTSGRVADAHRQLKKSQPAPAPPTKKTGLCDLPIIGFICDIFGL